VVSYFNFSNVQSTQNIIPLPLYGSYLQALTID
jgi:hypothetical protein